MMTRGLTLGRFVVALALLAVSTSAMGQYVAVLDGRLETPDDRKPVAGAVVEFFSEESNRSFTVKTDKKGRFVRQGMRPGVYRAVIKCEGYHSLNVKGINIKPSAITKLILELQPAR